MEAQGSRALHPSMVSVDRKHEQRDTDRRSEYPAARHPRFQHRLIRPSRVVAHRDRAPARITLHHLLRKLRHAPVQPRTLRNPAAAEAFSRDLVLIKQHRPVERHPVPRASGPTADTLSVLTSPPSPTTPGLPPPASASWPPLLATSSRRSRGPLTQSRRSPAPPRRDDAFPCPVGQVPRFMRPGESRAIMAGKRDSVSTPKAFGV